MIARTIRGCIFLLAAALVCAGPAVVRAQTPAPLVAWYPMTNAGDAARLVDAGPLHYDGALSGAKYAGAEVGGPGLRFEGSGSSATVGPHEMLDKLGAQVTVSLWVKVLAFPTHDVNVAPLVRKRPTLQFSVGWNQALAFDGYTGGDWYQAWGGHFEKGVWTHVAFTLDAGKQRVFYINGTAVDSRPAPIALWPTQGDLLLGGSDWTGLMRDARIYAAALTPEQIRQDMVGTLPTRAATPADAPAVPYPIAAALVRYDMPVGFSEGYGRTRQAAVRKAGPDAVDWPALSLNGKPTFAGGAEQMLFLPVKGGGLFQAADDPVIEPGNHWFRPLNWIWNQQYVYTGDRAARSWAGRYELWTFPVVIGGPGERDVADVVLRCEGREIYRNAGPLHSLTLLLPQNEPSKPYELSVAGRGPITFSAGLKPVTLGAPKDEPFRVSQTMPGPGALITVRSLDRPDTFPNPGEWEADMKALSQPVLAPPAVPALGGSMRSYLGLAVPRSPLTVNAIALPAGMSANFLFGSQAWASRDAYADYLADTGFDRVFEQIGENGMPDPGDANSYERWALALRAKGIQAGFIPDTSYHRPFASDPNLTFYAATLPDYHAPVFRQIQLPLERLSRYGNFAGVSLGADNAGHVPYWDWAPPIPNRPWAEAYTNFQGGLPNQVPVGPALTPGKDYEVRGTEKQFVDWVTRYDSAFRQYGYFERAVREAAPSAILTTGSFGSSPGGGGRGGWPWATVPGKPMFEGLPVLQAYDWNETGSTLPLHQEALLDTLRSYYPDKPAWALIDDFALHLGSLPERERAYALALTRGVQAVGTATLAPPTGPQARPDIAADQKQIAAWVHRYGGTYAMTRPLPTVGVLYVYEQALSRPIIGGGGDTPDEAALLRGPQEGKAAEALFLCHAAGWPARIITPEELKRGLPPSMKAVLLVGLNTFDETWHWYDGLTPALTAWTQRGGRLLCDDESVCPLPAVKTGLRVRAYVGQRSLDWTGELIARNADNITRLRAALAGLPQPIASSTDPTVWAMPAVAGSTLFVTVVNQAGVPGKNTLKPQTGLLTWHTDRPIYDVRLTRRVTVNEASRVDLTQHGFQWYALPLAPPTAPTVTIKPDADGFFAASPGMGGARPLTGIPVEITVTHGGETVSVFAATGAGPARLPVRAVADTAQQAGNYAVTVTELLSGLATKATIRALPPRPAAPLPVVHILASPALAAFSRRRDVPLTLALTPAQAENAQIKALANRLIAFYGRAGRPVTLRQIAPGDVVRSLQPLQSESRYPQWLTIDSDLILLGSPSDNILLHDQARGGLLTGYDTLVPGQAAVQCVSSPFVGERNCLNLIAPDAAGLAAAVNQVTHD